MLWAVVPLRNESGASIANEHLLTDRVALLHGAPVTDAMARHARLHRQDWLPVTSSKPEP